MIDTDEKLAEAEKKLLDARRKTAEELAAREALPKLFPGGRQQLEDMVKQDPQAFGPKGEQFAKDLHEASPEACAETKRIQEEIVKEAESIQAGSERGEAERNEQAQQKKNWRDTVFGKNTGDDTINKFDESIRKDREASQKKDLKSAKEEAPGVEGLIRNQLKALIQSGVDEDTAQFQVRGQLQNRFGAETAGALVGEQAGSVKEQLMSEYLQGPDVEKQHRNSQVIGAEGLAASIQSAVGGRDEQLEQLKKIYEQNQRSADALSKIANAPRSSLSFGADGNLG